MQGPQNGLRPGGVRSGAVFSPHQVAQALLGTDKIVLEGFGNEAHDLPPDIPTVRSDQLDDFAAQAASVQAARRHSRRKLAFAAAVALSLALAAAFSLGQLLGATWRSTPNALVWSVTAVQADGLLATVGEHKLHFPIGSVLPSGDTLQSVDPAKSTFTTDRQTVSLHPLSAGPPRSK